MGNFDNSQFEDTMNQLGKDVLEKGDNLSGIYNHLETIGAFSNGKIPAETDDESVKKIINQYKVGLDIYTQILSADFIQKMGKFEESLRPVSGDADVNFANYLNKLNGLEEGIVNRYRQEKEKRLAEYKKIFGEEYEWVDIVSTKITDLEDKYLKGDRVIINNYLDDKKNAETLALEIEASEASIDAKRDILISEEVRRETITNDLVAMVNGLTTNYSYDTVDETNNRRTFKLNKVHIIEKINNKLDQGLELNKTDKNGLYNHYLIGACLLETELLKIINDESLNGNSIALLESLDTLLSDKRIVPDEKLKPSSEFIDDENKEIINLHEFTLKVKDDLAASLKKTDTEQENIAILGAKIAENSEKITKMGESHVANARLREIFAISNVPFSVIESQAAKEPVVIVPKPERRTGLAPIKIKNKKEKSGLNKKALAVIMGLALVVGGVLAFVKGCVPTKQVEPTPEPTPTATMTFEAPEEINLEVLDFYQNLDAALTVTEEAVDEYMEPYIENEIFTEERQEAFEECFVPAVEISQESYHNLLDDLVKEEKILPETAEEYKGKAFPALTDVEKEDIETLRNITPTSKRLAEFIEEHKEHRDEFFDNLEERTVILLQINEEAYNEIITGLVNAGIDEATINKFKAECEPCLALDMDKLLVFQANLDKEMALEEQKTVTRTVIKEVEKPVVVEKVEVVEKPVVVPAEKPSEPSGPSGPSVPSGPVNPEPGDDPKTDPTIPPQGDWFEENQVEDTPTDDSKVDSVTDVYDNNVEKGLTPPQAAVVQKQPDGSDEVLASTPNATEGVTHNHNQTNDMYADLLGSIDYSQGGRSR